MKFKPGDVVRVVHASAYGVIVKAEPNATRVGYYRVRIDTVNFRHFYELGAFEDELEGETR